MQKMRFFRRCLPLFLAFWLLLAVAGAPFAAYAGESVTVRDSSGQVRYAAPMDPENACPALQSALDMVRSGAYGTCTVTVTPGEYRMTKSAVLASDMTLNLTGVTLLNANAGKGNIFISPNRVFHPIGTVPARTTLDILRWRTARCGAARWIMRRAIPTAPACCAWRIARM